MEHPEESRAQDSTDHACQKGHQEVHPEGHQKGAPGHHYRTLLLMTLLSYAAMYALMYAMVDSWSSVYANLNQAYMAGLMTAPMVVFELLLMRAMYRNRRRNVAIVAATIVAGVGCFLGIRRQILIGDGEFLRSMIPHHSGAILMCREASIRERSIEELCRNIIVSQRSEINEMKALLARR